MIFETYVFCEYYYSVYIINHLKINQITTYSESKEVRFCVLFIVMIVFQLSGALILLFNLVDSRKDKVIKNCFPGSSIVIRDENNYCFISKAKLQKSARTIYLNIFAFVDLVIGYALAAFDPQTDISSFIRVIIIISASMLLSLIESNLCNYMARKKYNENLKIPYDSIASEDVISPATVKEANEYLEINK